MDRLEAMTILVAVAGAGSLTAAGRRLNIPLPTVSRKLGELETRLGARLLVRTTRRLALTEAGRAYVADCKRILDEIGDAERRVAGEYAAPTGEIVIAAPVVFGRLHVMPMVNEFLAAHPAIDARLILSDRNADLLDDHIDVAVRIGTLPGRSMVAVKAGAVRRIVCGSPTYFAAHGIPGRPRDLAALACVTFDAFGPPAAWIFAGKAHPRERTVPVRARLSVNTAEAAVDAAIAGVGVTRVLSYQAARAVREGKLEVALSAFEPAPLPVNIILGSQRMLPRKTRSFVDFALPRLRARLAGLSDLGGPSPGIQGRDGGLPAGPPMPGHSGPSQPGPDDAFVR